LGSVTRAAEELCLAQPTVSMRLKKLAAALEIALFAQRGRRLQLTAGGAALRESCLEVFAAFRRIDERLAAFRSYNSQPVVEDGAWRVSTTRR
jgi:DNA-binding transcriptional LysR family regulator